MNRQIKFRGKDILTNEWAYSSLLTDNKYVFAILVPEIQESGKLKFKHKEVDPVTVGQFTGLTDKNGKEIYEGDVVKFGSQYGSISEVKYINNGGYLVKDKWGDWQGLYDVVYSTDCIVIGNIHDNPELLK